MLRTAARRAWAALALAAVTSVPLLAGAPLARADIVRDDQLWVLDAVSAPAAWKITKGSGVIVAVIDSGIWPQASDLAGSVIRGANLTDVPTPPSSPGWGIHGTWMASLIAGHGHDGGSSGILGTAPQAKVLSIRVITDRKDPNYAAYQDESPARGQRELARAIRYAVRHHASVISMSLGYDMPSRPVRTAMQDAADHGVVVVASSGNSGGSAAARRAGHAPYSFPADYPGVLSVGAVNRYGQPASFSSGNISVQVAAPGVSVPAQGRDGQYWLVSGTSPACALTAGVAALIKSRYPDLAPALVREAIIDTAQHRPRGGYDEQVGAGTVDAVRALREAGRLNRLDSADVGTAASRDGGPAAGRASPARHSTGTGRYFGGGPAAVPPLPVSPRGVGTLILLLLLGVCCLGLVAASAMRLVSTWRGPGDGEPASPWPGAALGQSGPDDPGSGRRPEAGGAGALSGSRFPWQVQPGGRHAAPADKRDAAAE
ncbi:MAG: S8 family peptidase [Streptosporangiaceae bacterium]